jgi:tetratricopeptide (TPR) repeat protein
VTQRIAKTKLSEPIAALLLLTLTTACAGLLLAQPRRVPPLELPSLTLPADAVRSVIAQDAQAARKAPSSPAAQAFEKLLDEQGQAETLGSEGSESYASRRAAIVQSYKTLAGEVGESAALRLRAKAVERLEDALELRLDTTHARPVIGAFNAVLERENASRDGYLVAPRFVVRTLYKARWNILAGLPPDHAFERIERRAFYGWQALHSDNVALEKRVAALHEYGQSGGDHVEEALGILLFRLGDYAQSARALETAYRKQGSIRLRNNLLAARSAAGFSE